MDLRTENSILIEVICFKLLRVIVLSLWWLLDCTVIGCCFGELKVSRWSLVLKLWFTPNSKKERSSHSKPQFIKRKPISGVLKLTHLAITSDYCNCHVLNTKILPVARSLLAQCRHFVLAPTYQKMWSALWPRSNFICQKFQIKLTSIKIWIKWELVWQRSELGLVSPAAPFVVCSRTLHQTHRNSKTETIKDNVMVDADIFGCVLGVCSPNI